VFFRKYELNFGDGVLRYTYLNSTRIYGYVNAIKHRDVLQMNP